MSGASSTQRVALVTGGVRRIGAALAARLAHDGFAVVLHTSARSAQEAEEVAARMRTDGARVAVVAADLCDVGETDALLGHARAAFGSIDILINNASIFERDEIANLEVESFDRHQAINLRAPLLLARRFAEHADAARDPSIINVLDQRALAPNPYYLSYTLSKTGLLAATKILAQALAPHIRVNAIAPGPVLPNASDGKQRFAAEVAHVPLARAVPLEAVVDAAAYLIAARHVTGQVIAVDSGQHLAWRTPDVIAAFGDDGTS